MVIRRTVNKTEVYYLNVSLIFMNGAWSTRRFYKRHVDIKFSSFSHLHLTARNLVFLVEVKAICYVNEEEDEDTYDETLLRDLSHSIDSF